jgi:integrase/recombinase XerD
MSRIKVILRQGKTDQRKDGSFPLYLKMASGSVSYRSLQIAVLPEHWIASEERVSKKHPYHKEYNQIIEKALNEGEKALVSLKVSGNSFRAKDIKARVKQRKYVDFLECAEKYNKQYEDAHYTGRAKKSQLTILTRYHPGITWTDITKDFLETWIRKMQTQGLKPTTIHHRIRYVRAIVRLAEREKVYQWESDPFQGIKINARVEPKDGLTKEEIKSFRNVILPEGWLKNSQRIFLLQFNLWGMNIGDLLKLKQENIKEGILRYERSKTKRKQVPVRFVIELTPEAKELIEQMQAPGSPYLLPFIKETKNQLKTGRQIETVTAKVNQSLKVIGQRAGIDKNITTYYSRYTWAQLFLIKTGGNVRLLQTAYGHSTVVVTEQYTGSRDYAVINELNKEMMAG